jgi:hypothetical protein
MKTTQKNTELQISIKFYTNKLWDERGYGLSYLLSLTDQDLISLYNEEFEDEF